LLTGAEGEPLAVRVFSGNTAHPATVVGQIKTQREKFQVLELSLGVARGR
jgi:hypothetical protein